MSPPLGRQDTVTHGLVGADEGDGPDVGVVADEVDRLVLAVNHVHHTVRQTGLLAAEHANSGDRTRRWKSRQGGGKAIVLR